MRPKSAAQSPSACLDLYAAYLLPQLLRRFARAHPHVEIEMRCMRSVHLYEAMLRDELDSRSSPPSSRT